MHELPIVKQILDVALAYAEENGAKKVSCVVLQIGEFHDLIPEWVEKYFHFASRGTIAAESKIKIEREPIICRCNGCTELFVFHLGNGDSKLTCPICQSEDCCILSGSNLLIKEIEII